MSSLDVVVLDDGDGRENDGGAGVRPGSGGLRLARVKSGEMAKTSDSWAHRPKIDKQIVNDKDRAWYFKKWAGLEEGNKQASFYREIGKNFLVLMSRALPEESGYQGARVYLLVP
jgi:hypothetical protein